MPPVVRLIRASLSPPAVPLKAATVAAALAPEPAGCAGGPRVLPPAAAAGPPEEPWQSESQWSNNNRLLNHSFSLPPLRIACHSHTARNMASLQGAEPESDQFSRRLQLQTAAARLACMCHIQHIPCVSITWCGAGGSPRHSFQSYKCGVLQALGNGPGFHFTICGNGDQQLLSFRPPVHPAHLQQRGITNPPGVKALPHLEARNVSCAVTTLDP
jgi:predicted small lipoprotein YifL